MRGGILMEADSQDQHRRFVFVFQMSRKSPNRAKLLLEDTSHDPTRLFRETLALEFTTKIPSPRELEPSSPFRFFFALTTTTSARRLI